MTQEQKVIRAKVGVLEPGIQTVPTRPAKAFGCDSRCARLTTPAVCSRSSITASSMRKSASSPARQSRGPFPQRASPSRLISSRKTSPN